LFIDIIKPLTKYLHEQDIWQSKQCLSYLPCKVLRLPFQNRLLLLDKTMHIASLIEGVYDEGPR